MQDAIAMGFSLPDTENFSPFFENIKFGHQNILLKRLIELVHEIQPIFPNLLRFLRISMTNGQI